MFFRAVVLVVSLQVREKRERDGEKLLTNDPRQVGKVSLTSC